MDPASANPAGESWSIDIPGLGQQDAQRLRTALESEFPHGVVLLDPRSCMMRGFDAATVRLVARCLKLGMADGQLDRLHASGAQSMLEDCQDWLKQAGESSP